MFLNILCKKLKICLAGMVCIYSENKLLCLILKMGKEENLFLILEKI